MSIRLFFAALLLSLSLSLAFGQQSVTVQQLEMTQQLLDENRHLTALQVSKQAYYSAERMGNSTLMAHAKAMEAFAMAGPAPERLNNRKKRRTLRVVNDAQSQLSSVGEDSLLLLVNRLERRIEGKEVKKVEPGGLAQVRPGAIELAKKAKQILSSTVDTISVLKADRERFRKKVEALTLEQAQQDLILALQQQTLDSIATARMADSLILAQQEQELQTKQAQLELRRTQRNRSLILAGAIIIIAAILFLLYFNSRRKNRTIQHERQRSDNLLLNILPASVAEELKTNGTAAARHYDEVTVLFTDFKDFSRVTKDLSPQELVEALDRCFRAFDEIAERHGLEKIKTIGDAYMCAAGLPEPSEDQAKRAVRAAQDMQAWLSKAKDLPFPGARIGLHTGPVVAGVVGARKFAYDIWGDTVNLASRLESKGEIGRVNISQSTYEQVKDQFNCTSRGKVPAKGVGEVEMYFVE
jgi:class 3 adenylate cyclase